MPRSDEEKGVDMSDETRFTDKINGNHCSPVDIRCLVR